MSVVSLFHMRLGFLGVLFALLIVLYLVLAAYLYIQQRSFLYFPDARRPAVADAEIPELREIQLTTAEGLHLLAWYVPPPSPGRPVVLYFHGNGGNIADRTGRIAMFARANYGVLMPEYRGYGGNPGSPSEQAFITDAEVALSFLHREAMDNQAIVVYGESLGTGIAVALAEKRLMQALVLDAPYTNIAAVAEKRFFFLPVRWMLKDLFDSLSRIGNIRAPVLIIQGERDGVIPPALGRALFAKAQEPKELWTDPDGNHSDLLERGAIKVVLDFLEKHGPH